MFEGKSEEELVTLTQRENMAVSIAKELAAFLLGRTCGFGFGGAAGGGFDDVLPEVRAAGNAGG